MTRMPEFLAWFVRLFLLGLETLADCFRRPRWARLEVHMKRRRTIGLVLAMTALVLAVGTAWAQLRSPDWRVVHDLALERIGTERAPELAVEIADSVTGRGTVWLFMHGKDGGVLYGLGAAETGTVVRTVQDQGGTVSRPLFGGVRMLDRTYRVGDSVNLAMPTVAWADRWYTAYTAEGLPSGLTYSASAHTIEGTVDTAQTSRVTLKAVSMWDGGTPGDTSDDVTLRDQLAFTITVNQA